jgi:S-adenosylmethionine:tRNA-ribosyltransferase-isomerase (queuine synthetase)
MNCFTTKTVHSMVRFTSKTIYINKSITMQEAFKNLIEEWSNTPLPRFIHRNNEEYLHQSYANIYAII